MQRASRLLATYADMEELIRLGAYRAGASAEVDEAIGLNPALEAFLTQAKDDSTSLADGYRRLAEIVGGGQGGVTLRGGSMRPDAAGAIARSDLTASDRALRVLALAAFRFAKPEPTLVENAQAVSPIARKPGRGRPRGRISHHRFPW